MNYIMVSMVSQSERGEKTDKKGGLVVLAQTQECNTCGAKVRSVVTPNNNNYGSIQHSLVGEYPNSHAYGVRNNSRPTHPSWPSKKRGGGGEEQLISYQYN